MKALNKVLCYLLAMLLCFSLAACKSDTPETSWESSAESEDISDPNNEVSLEDTSSDVSGTPELDNNPENSEDSDVPGGDENPDNETTTTRKTTTSIDPSGNVITEPTTKKPTTIKTTTKKTKPGETTAKPTTIKTTTKKTQPGETTKKTTAGKTTTKRPTAGRNNNDTIRRDVKISSGKSKVSTYTNKFKGKSYTSIMSTETYSDAITNELKAFAAKYGFTLKQDKVNFETVVTTVSTSLASGKAYDIVRIQGSWYPRIIISKLLKPLEDAISVGDCTTDKDTTGIDFEKSSFFAWNNRLYALTTYDYSPIIYMYYNKADYKHVIGHDPMELYKQGKWTWQQLKDDANLAADQGRKYGDYALVSHHWQLTNGTKLVQETNGKMTINMVNNQNYINSLRFMQGLAGFGNGTGMYKPLDAIENSGGTDKYDNLMNGKILIWPSESSRYFAVYNKVKDSTYFKQNTDNLGICPMPLGPDNKSGAYGGGYLNAFAAGRGSAEESPELVAALCVFHSTYKNESAAQPTAEEQAVFKKLYKNVNVMDYGYGLGSDNLNSISHSVANAVIAGRDITATLKRYEGTAKDCLKNCLDAQ